MATKTATTTDWNNAKSTFGTGSTSYANTIGSITTRYRHSVARMGSKSSGYSGTVYTKWIVEETILSGDKVKIDVYLAVWLKRGYWMHNRGNNLTTESSANWTTENTSATKTSLKHRYSWRINGSEKMYLIIGKGYTTPTSWKRLYTGNTYDNTTTITSSISATNSRYPDYEHVYSTTLTRSKTTNNLGSFTIEYRRDSYSYDNEYGSLTWTGTTITQQAPLWPYINVKYNTNGGTLSSSVSNPTKWYWGNNFSPSTAITKTGYTLSLLESSNKNYLPDIKNVAFGVDSFLNSYPSNIGTEVILTAQWEENGTPAPPAITFNKDNYNIYETEDNTDGHLWYTYLSYNYTVYGSTDVSISLINGGPTKYVKMIDGSSVSLSNNYSQGFSIAKTSTYSNSVSSSKEIYYDYNQEDYQFIGSLTNDYYIQTPFRTYSSTTERYSPIVENRVYGPASSEYTAKKAGAIYHITPSTKYNESISYFNWYARESSSSEWISIGDGSKSLEWRKTFIPYEIKCEIINKDEWGQSTTITILGDSIDENSMVHFHSHGLLAKNDWEQYDWKLINDSANFCGFFEKQYSFSIHDFYNIDETGEYSTLDDDNYIIIYVGDKRNGSINLTVDYDGTYITYPCSLYNTSYVIAHYNNNAEEIEFDSLGDSDLASIKIKNKLAASRIKLWFEGNAVFKKKANNTAFKYIE